MENVVQNDVSALSRIDAVKMILKTMSDLTGLSVSLVVRLTDDSWTACAVHDDANFGIKPGDKLELSNTYWDTIRGAVAPLLVRHASNETLFQTHPGLQVYGVESYLGVPLFRQNGEFFGTLCALDTKPKNFSEKNIETFALMAKLIAYELEAEEQRSALDESLKFANQTNETRARFMGILGHDLRNPLNTIVMAATVQQGDKFDAERNALMSEKILRTARRMQFLIEDLLDASQTAQGNRILIQKKAGDLRDICEPLIEEFRLTNPNRKIDFFAQESCHGEWDEGRFGQILSNLLSNAISYGSSHFPIKVNLIGECDRVVLQINNQGETMSEEVLKNLFTAFWRGAKKVGTNANSSGLGLGLYIVKQIVEAHGGTISVKSERDYGTTFTVIFLRDTQTEN